ncbi:ribonuclease-like [Monodelphis domestica]|uniref:ribonuclease-like n=1 Tax=Monodelphis domestica TaxID=13616 RepID=UPI00044312CC|nr:ribonuclease-like [Monodelphis domestica]
MARGQMVHAGMKTLFLLLLLDLTNFSQAFHFWNYHVDYPKTQVSGTPDQYCNVIMQRRGMITRNHCFQINAFIHETNSTLQNICKTSPKTCGGPSWLLCHESSKPLKLTYCSTQSYARPPNCGYKAQAFSEKILVVCVRGSPIYLFQT